MDLKIAVFLALVSVTLGAGNEPWGYVPETDGLLPGDWEDGYDACDGDAQSPIDIDTAACIAADTTLGTITFTDYDYSETEWKIFNNGHTITCGPNYDWATAIDASNPAVANPMKMSGGGLPKEYQFLQFHVHWGATDMEGSEHTIDGEGYPMELHLVHYDASKATIGEALATGDSDSLAVLGIMFTIGQTESPLVTTLLSYASDLEFKDDTATFTAPALTLAGLLPSNTDEFYRYDGSLTTPTCNEAVKWTVFKTPVSVTSAQMAEMRTMFKYTAEDSDNEVVMSTNYRPVMPLNDRAIKASFGSATVNDAECNRSGASAIHVSILSVLAALVAICYHL